MNADILNFIYDYHLSFKFLLVLYYYIIIIDILSF